MPVTEVDTVDERDKLGVSDTVIDRNSEKVFDRDSDDDDETDAV